MILIPYRTSLAVQGIVHLKGCRSITTAKEMCLALNARARAFEQVMQPLAREKLVQTKRGPTGGLALTERGKQASLYDIAMALNPENVMLEEIFHGWREITPERALQLIKTVEDTQGPLVPRPHKSSTLSARQRLLECT